MGCSRRPSSALAAIAAALLTLLAIAPAAHAIDITFFRTPSANIDCAFLGKNSLRCDMREVDNTPPPRPASCEFDYGTSFGLRPKGRGFRRCVSDSVRDPDARVVRYGHSIKRGGMRCTSRRTGLRCVNPAGHGFRLSRASQKLF
jgi:hypothetical protein